MQAGYSMPVPLGYSWRNRWVAGALGILLGGLGVHRFYLGFTGVGIIMVILCVCTAGIVSGVWGFIEGILCFCGAMRDVDGRPLSG
jgi:TM2 domain-containing membrane protein YozV